MAFESLSDKLQNAFKSIIHIDCVKSMVKLHKTTIKNYKNVI